ncbi:MAG TPA: hypothetical protein VFC78_01935 [Tepidisphaeraceae bacterium]|nr:hypothetical protein [Tepidisphaeraceae bacterium]
MHRLIHSHILLPAFETLYKRRKTFRYLKELERTQWLSRSELDAIQFRALQRVLAHAYANCPFYQNQWQGLSLNPGAIQSVADLERWPIVDRTTIRLNRHAMRSRIADDLMTKATGGSSGEPLQFDLNVGSNDRRVAASYRGYGWAGAYPGTKQLYLWGGSLEPQPRRRQRKDQFYHGLHRRTYLSTFGLSSESLLGYFNILNDYRPDFIVAYTNSLYEFARMLEDRHLEPFSPRAMIVGAEKLHSFQREVIERVFHAPVFETYGSREFMLVGAECDRHMGLHLTQENLLVEVVRPDGTRAADGEEGDLLVTDLYNYGMPFIRYQTGDRAVAGWKQCACGRGLPLLRRVTGRSMDTLMTPDGRRISGAMFPHLLKDFPAIRRFQVIQDSPDHVELRLVASAAWNDADRVAIETIIRAKLGPEVRFETHLVEDIALTGAGKLRVVVNRCALSQTQEPMESRPVAFLAGSTFEDA